MASFKYYNDSNSSVSAGNITIKAKKAYYSYSNVPVLDELVTAGTISRDITEIIPFELVSQDSTTSGDTYLGKIGGITVNPSSSFTRPNDISQYSAGDLVANSVTAGSVVPLDFTVTRTIPGSTMLRRCRLIKSGTSTTNAAFKLHILSVDPTTITNGDNGAFSISNAANYLGAFDITVDTVFTDGSVGIGIPSLGSELGINLLTSNKVYGLLEAKAAYTPASGEIFTVILDVYQD